QVNETTGVGSLLRPGNHVDILTKVTAEKRTITSFVFQNIPVLAVGPAIGFTTRSATSAQDRDGYSTVTLSVTPEQAETLMYLDNQPLRLILRAPSDEEIVVLSPVSEAETLAKLGRFTPKSRHLQVIHNDPIGE